jgi:ABC-type nickel/cobalt efflux system permease component RcnA
MPIILYFHTRTFTLHHIDILKSSHSCSSLFIITSLYKSTERKITQLVLSFIQSLCDFTTQHPYNRAYHTHTHTHTHTHNIISTCSHIHIRVPLQFSLQVFVKGSDDNLSD